MGILQDIESPFRFGGRATLPLRPDRAADPLPAPAALDVDWPALAAALGLRVEDGVVLEHKSAGFSRSQTASELGWSNVRVRNALDRVQRQLGKGTLVGRSGEFVREGRGSRRSLNPVRQVRSAGGRRMWELSHLDERNFASVMRGEVLQVIKTKASAFVSANSRG